MILVSFKNQPAEVVTCRPWASLRCKPSPAATRRWVGGFMVSTIGKPWENGSLMGYSTLNAGKSLIGILYLSVWWLFDFWWIVSFHFPWSSNMAGKWRFRFRRATDCFGVFRLISYAQTPRGAGIFTNMETS